jgi:predicted transcriptional regulator of viral defense system
MDPKSTTVEQVIARLASRKHGLVTRSGLLRSGITHDQIRGRLRKGLLIRLHKGVYRVGHRAPSLEAHYLAAVLACGDGAVLSGPAAAHLLHLLKGKSPPPEVTVPTRRRAKGVKIRRSDVRCDERTLWRGIPATSVPRILVDVAAGLDADSLAKACHEAGVRYGTTPAEVEKVLARRPNTPGAGKLRAILRGDFKVMLSKLEQRVALLFRKEGLELPEMNRPAGGRRVDCRWPKHRLTVEFDSFRYHNSRHTWEQDRRREREAYARGDDFRRYTWGDVFERPAAMLTELRTLLSASPVSP